MVTHPDARKGPVDRIPPTGRLTTFRASDQEFRSADAHSASAWDTFGTHLVVLNHKRFVGSQIVDHLACRGVTDGQPSVHFKVEVPAELDVGAYANFLSVWHTPHEFTLDFAVMMPGQQADSGEVEVPCRVVARIKIPTTVAEEVLKALATNITRYEQSAGPIKRPGEDLKRPEEPS